MREGGRCGAFDSSMGHCPVCTFRIVVIRGTRLSTLPVWDVISLADEKYLLNTSPLWLSVGHAQFDMRIQEAFMNMWYHRWYDSAS